MRLKALLTSVVICAVSAAAATPLLGRTIELTDADADRIAAIGPEAPRMGWAAHEAAPGIFTTDHLTLRPKASLLIRVPLDKIPPGMRITKAEWTIMVPWASVNEPKLYVWRLLSDWGVGACYLYRTVKPEPVPWNQEGARGPASDRAERPSVVETCKIGKPVTLNVTEDVELWYTGAAQNNGWMFTVEDEIQLRLNPPTYTTRGTWKLRITYEPAE